MKILSLIKKNLILQIRDYWSLLITVSLGPFFVVIYWLITAGFPSYYNILVVNHDSGTQGQALIAACQNDSRVSETMHLHPVASTEAGRQLLKKRDADAMIEIPESFSQSLVATPGDTFPPRVHFYGEKSNTRYLVGVITAYTAVDGFIRAMTGAKEPWKMEETFIDEEKIKRSDFDLQVPGILILSVIMLLFSAGMLIIRDVEDRTLQRLRLTSMTVLDYVSSMAFVQVLVGVISVVSTYWLSVLFGFQGLGSILSVVTICLIAFIGVIGATLWVVSFCQNATVFVIAGQFPLFILIFFSGAMMPIPRLPLFHLWGNAVCWNDLLPTGMSVIALNAVFNDGKDIADLPFQTGFSIVVSVVYWAIGIFGLNKKHLKI